MKEASIIKKLQRTVTSWFVRSSMMGEPSGEKKAIMECIEDILIILHDATGTIGVDPSENDHAT